MKKKPNRSKVKNPQFADHNISTLDQYRRAGGNLTPPLADIGPIAFSKWRDEGLNEVLWAAILRANMERSACLTLFRRVVVKAHDLDPIYKNSFISHSALASLAPSDFDNIIEPILGSEEAKYHLRSLLLFSTPPDIGHWKRHLADPDSQEHTLTIMKAVADCLDHQSQESTDIRWFKLMYCAIVQQRLKFPSGVDGIDEILEGFRLYPDFGDQRKIRPHIRALEAMLRGVIDDKHHPSEIPPEIREHVPQPWSEAFWRECIDRSECIPPEFKAPEHNEIKWYFEQLFELYGELAGHFHATLENSGIDARRDAVFGLALYCIFIGFTIANTRSDKRAEGRILLRTIIECYITLKYLVFKDEPTIWEQFRSHGTGQTKLAFLKNIREESVPDFINLEDLHQYANEDRWQEFTNIRIKPWSEKNIRKMAEESGQKDFYDKYYDWSSGYVHGNWGAIRDTVFVVCLNPLHRLHRIPVLPRLDASSVLPDTAKIINLMLESLNHCYPTFKKRVKHQS